MEITSDPGSDGEYVNGDAIEITVTYSEAVAVTGTPQIKTDFGAPEIEFDMDDSSPPGREAASESG